VSVREKCLLQICVVVGGGVPVVAGLLGVTFGTSSVADGIVGVSMDSHFRYLSGLLLAIGLGFWSTVPGIETKTARFRMLTGLVVVGGLGRAASLLAVGLPTHGMLAALVMELGVTPLLCLWQTRASAR
jgi:hypothetical protein